VLSEWPASVPFKVPVDSPIINPSTSTPPVSQTTRVTLGSPQLVPLSNPPQYKTPVIDIVPSPTGGEPWRVDVQPKDITSIDPSAPPDVATPPATPASGTTATPKEGDPPGLCDLYPDIAACAKLDTPDAPNLDTIEKPVTVTPDTGWGAENAACPAARHITVQGRDIPIPFDLFCQYMAGIRPMVIAMAWLSAGFILLGARGGD